MRKLLFSMWLLATFTNSAATNAEECKPSKWGKDDEIGAANYVTPEQVRLAAGLVKKGESHGLGIVIEPGMPAYPPRYTQLQVVQPGQQFNFDTSKDYGWPLSSNDDLVQMWLGTGPQLDGLGHLGEAGYFYNCNKGSDFSDITGLTKLGTHKVPPMIGRGLLIDMAKHFGVNHLKGGQAFGSKDIESAMTEQGVDIREGDVGAILGWGCMPWAGGPLSWLDLIGAKEAVSICKSLESNHGSRFSPPDLLTDLINKNETFYTRFPDGKAN